MTSPDLPYLFIFQITTSLLIRLAVNVSLLWCSYAIRKANPSKTTSILLAASMCTAIFVSLETMASVLLLGGNYFPSLSTSLMDLYMHMADFYRWSYTAITLSLATAAFCFVSIAKSPSSRPQVTHGDDASDVAT